MGVVLDHYEEFSHRYRCHQPRLLSKLLVKLPDKQRGKKKTKTKTVCLPPLALVPVTAQMGLTWIPRTNSRVIHEVVDFPHGHTSNVHKEDKTQQHKVVFRRHPQHKLQVEGI